MPRIDVEVDGYVKCEGVFYEKVSVTSPNLVLGEALTMHPSQSCTGCS